MATVSAAPRAITAALGRCRVPDFSAGAVAAAIDTVDV